MIDRQRILALAQQPRDWEADGQAAARRVQALGMWHREDSLLARPVMWSEAACCNLPERRALPSRRIAEGLCVLCPIEEDCRTALLVGAPEGVQEWRGQLDAP
ncbi:hypothetical protein [Streptomyces abikoensis]